jgi:prevent-host-death family protein
VKRKPMLRIVPAAKVKNNFGEVIKRVYENDEVQIIERAGLPVAGIVSMSDIERLYPEKVKQMPRLERSAKRQQAWDRLIKVLDETQKGGEKFTEEEVEADVLRAVQEVRHGTQNK